MWRFSNPDQKEMVWEFKYGKGFPGWHIECSVMSMKYLGEHFDIHTGGVDHLPIHHTNEIPQSEVATGKKFVNFWVHSGFLKVNGEKMSKSLGNVYKIQDLVDKGYSTKAFRYLVLSSHYRSQMNFTFEALDNASNTLNGIYAFIKKLSDIKEDKKKNSAFLKKVKGLKSEFFKFIDDDLNTPRALSGLHALISETNRLSEIGKAESESVLEALLEFDKILGLDFEIHMKKQELTQEIKKLIEERNRLRKEKRFNDSDKIREKLRKEYHVELEDTPSGTSWHVI